MALQLATIGTWPCVGFRVAGLEEIERTVHQFVMKEIELGQPRPTQEQPLITNLATAKRAYAFELISIDQWLGYAWIINHHPIISAWCHHDFSLPSKFLQDSHHAYDPRSAMLTEANTLPRTVSPTALCVLQGARPTSRPPGGYTELY